MKVWVWRSDSGYYLSPGRKPKKSLYFGGYESSNVHAVLTRYYNQLGGPRLKHGDDPVQVEITVKEIK